MLTSDEEQAIQDFRFANRIGTKAEAARQLIGKGLEASKSGAGKEMATTGDEIGVMAPAEAGNNSNLEKADVCTDI